MYSLFAVSSYISADRKTVVIKFTKAFFAETIPFIISAENLVAVFLRSITGQLPYT